MSLSRCKQPPGCCSPPVAPKPAKVRCVAARVASREMPVSLLLLNTQTLERRSPPSSPRNTYVAAGPQGSDEPTYEQVDKRVLSRVVMALFRKKMVVALGEDVPEKGYDGIISLTRKLNAPPLTPRDTQLKTIAILKSLFPAWLPPFFKAVFARFVPTFACQMNAIATALTCEWLMGKCTVNDVEVDGGELKKGHGVLVERCRYLEEAGCASICINSCKVPTQEFFKTDMGMNVTMTPNYDDFSCQFSFGKTPAIQALDPAFSSPCFQQCPSKRKPGSAVESSGCGGCPGIAPDSAKTSLVA
eukprot:gene13853-19776_t